MIKSLKKVFLKWRDVFNTNEIWLQPTRVCAKSVRNSKHENQVKVFERVYK